MEEKLKELKKRGIQAIRDNDPKKLMEIVKEMKRLYRTKEL